MRKKGFTQTTKSALSQQGLLDPIKPAYNQSRLTQIYSQCLRPTMYWCWQSWSQYPLLHRIIASFINFLHYCSPSSEFYDAAKDNRGRCTDKQSSHHPIQTNGASPPSPPISTPNTLSVSTLVIYPGLRQAPNNIGLPTRWLGYTLKIKIIFILLHSNCLIRWQPLKIMNLSETYEVNIHSKYTPMSERPRQLSDHWLPTLSPASQACLAYSNTTL